METANDKITIPQDGSALISWQFKVDGTPIDWTGWTGEIDIRKSRKQSSLLIAHLTSAAGDITCTNDGYWNVDFSPEIMEPIEPGTWHGDLRITSPTGRVEYPIRFSLVVTPTVTDLN